MADSPLKSEIEANAGGPQAMTGDEGSVTQHNLKDQIAADRYLAGQAAATAKSTGLYFRKIAPPGAA